MKIDTNKLYLAMARKYMGPKDLAAVVECSVGSIV